MIRPRSAAGSAAPAAGHLRPAGAWRHELNHAAGVEAFRDAATDLRAWLIRHDGSGGWGPVTRACAFPAERSARLSVAEPRVAAGRERSFSGNAVFKEGPL